MFKSSSNYFSVFQIKYQSYLEPDITKKIIEIQYYLSWAAQDIKIYKRDKREKYKLKESEQSLGEIIENIRQAAKLTQEITIRIELR